METPILLYVFFGFMVLFGLAIAVLLIVGLYYKVKLLKRVSKDPYR
jgi:hypothetical protein